MTKFIKSIPMAIGGVSLSLAALGNLLLPLPNGQTIRYFLGILSLVFLIIYAMKLFLDPRRTKEELKTPIPLSVLPTATMALMLLSAYIRPYTGNFAVGLWYVTLAVHVVIMIVFVKRFVLGFKLDTVFPSWFITGVGLVVASVTAPAMNAILVGRIAFWVGFFLYFVVLMLVILRMRKVRVFPEPARKTIAIFTAPMSLLVVGYFSSFVSQGVVNPTLVYIMLAIAAASYIYTTIMLFTLMKIRFYPTYAAFTFPYVISAIAFRLGANFLTTRHGIDFLPAIADITMWIAVALVIYVIIQYIRYFRFWLKY